MDAESTMPKQFGEQVCLKEPSFETLEAMEELHSGGGKCFTSVAELIADLNADD
jgi:hypothetical protein